MRKKTSAKVSEIVSETISEAEEDIWPKYCKTYQEKISGITGTRDQNEQKRCMLTHPRASASSRLCPQSAPHSRSCKACSSSSERPSRYARPEKRGSPGNQIDWGDYSRARATVCRTEGRFTRGRSHSFVEECLELRPWSVSCHGGRNVSTLSRGVWRRSWGWGVELVSGETSGVLMKDLVLCGRGGCLKFHLGAWRRCHPQAGRGTKLNFGTRKDTRFKKNFYLQLGYDTIRNPGKRLTYVKQGQYRGFV